MRMARGPVAAGAGTVVPQVQTHCGWPEHSQPTPEHTYVRPSTLQAETRRWYSSVSWVCLVPSCAILYSSHQALGSPGLPRKSTVTMGVKL